MENRKPRYSPLLLAASIGGALAGGCGHGPESGPTIGGAARVGTAQQADTLGVFTAVNAPAGTQVNIVIPTHQTTVDINYLIGLSYYDVHNARPDLEPLWNAIHYVREGIFKMTGALLNVVSSDDLSSGIILSTLGASTEISQTFGSCVPTPTGVEDTALEAYCISTSTNRTVIAANTVDGLVHGAVELLLGDHAQSGYVPGYEVLGMGPDWTYVPNYKTTALRFYESYTGRPGFYQRSLTDAGEERTPSVVYTISPLAKSAQGDDHPDDEPSQDSYNRWRVGTNQTGSSSPAFPGAAMQQYHHAIASKLANDYDVNHAQGVQTGVHGFLTTIRVGPQALRLQNPPNGNSDLWVESDNPVTPGVYAGVNGSWVAQNLLDVNQVADVSVDWVRDIVFHGFSVCNGSQHYAITGLVDSQTNDCQTGAKIDGRAKISFQNAPTAPFILATETEDHGPADAVFANLVAVPNWWPQYQSNPANNDPGGKPYVMNGTAYGPNVPQLTESWWATNGSPTPPTYPDVANAGSDSIFAFNNWILNEYDKYLAALPPNSSDAVVNGVFQEGRNTSAGVAKSTLIHTSFLSYSSHDVPPNFNADPRVRVEAAGGQLHRGLGKWTNIPDAIAMAKALHILLPQLKTNAAYAILSGYYDEDKWSSIAGGSHTAAYRQAWVKGLTDAGINALTAETNFNFGRQGLDYYMLTKLMWDPTLTADQLDALRTRWMQKAFGAGATAMKTYYDRMTPEQFQFNGPSFWATTIGYINQAETAINSTASAYQERLDDVKQYWYFYYLKDTVAQNGGAASAYPAFTEFVWKGQMSYVTNMFMVTGNYWQNHDCQTDGASYVYANGAYLRAHYLHSETAAWWSLVTSHWPPTAPNWFGNMVMANGQYGWTVDTHDLIPVVQFRNTVNAAVGSRYPSRSAVTANPYYQPDRVSVETTARAAGEVIGFQMFWPSNTARPGNVYYGVSYHDTSSSQTWTPQIAFPTGSQPTVVVTENLGGGTTQSDNVATVQYTAPQPGTYKFDVATTTWPSAVMSLDYDVSNSQHYTATRRAFTYETPADYLGGNQVFVYIPKNSRSFDLELPANDAAGGYAYTIEFFSGLPGNGAAMTRDVTVNKVGFNSIPLSELEKGSWASVLCSSTNCGSYRRMPYFYSAAPVYAFNLTELAIPRGLAAADGLVELKGQHLWGDATLHGGTQKGNSVDLLDVAPVAEFGNFAPGSYGMFLGVPHISSVYYDVVAKHAGDNIGFEMFWADAQAGPLTGQYGLYRYDPTHKNYANYTVPAWVPASADASNPNGYEFPNASMASQPITEKYGGTSTRLDDVVNVKSPAQAAGVWRLFVQPTGYSPAIVSDDFNLTTASYASPLTETFSRNEAMAMSYGGPLLVYIPKDTQTLDFELPGYTGPMTYNFQFYTGLPSTGTTATRLVQLVVGQNGVTTGFNSIPLQAGEAGSFVVIYSTNSISRYQLMPYLVSIPMRWAWATGQLALPRALIAADGLTVAQ